MKVLGITGGIGSGKSTVCEIFKILGIPIFNSDNVSKSILFTEKVSQEVIDLFGIDVLSNGNLDGSKLGILVFSNTEKLNSLNKILHPKVDKAFNYWKKKTKSSICR